MKKRVLVTYNMFRAGYAELIEKFDVTFPPEGRESFTYEEVLDMIEDYEVLQSMFNFKVDETLITKGKKLELISNYAVGFDNIDVACATRLGIQVTNTPHSVTEPTADQAMGITRYFLASCDTGVTVTRKPVSGSSTPYSTGSQTMRLLPAVTFTTSPEMQPSLTGSACPRQVAETSTSHGSSVLSV